jgi:hypothetical protein
MLQSIIFMGEHALLYTRICNYEVLVLADIAILIGPFDAKRQEPFLSSYSPSE